MTQENASVDSVAQKQIRRGSQTNGLSSRLNFLIYLANINIIHIYIYTYIYIYIYTYPLVN